MSTARSGLKDEKNRAELDDIIRKHKNKSSNLFLTQGDDLKSAVAGTFDAFVVGQSVDSPVSREIEGKSENYWVMVYLGVGSDGTKFTVSSVMRDGRSIRLSYVAKEPLGLPIVVQHLYWIPVGKLSSGAYRLEIYNSDLKQVILCRVVNIP